jgi:hypothetical protein
MIDVRMIMVSELKGTGEESVIAWFKKPSCICLGLNKQEKKTMMP